ncbi:MAG: transglutaminase-like putative cysteine protease [Marivirga sp.]|jgi:transglutaminase-like putative cysteine protease
MRKLMMVCLLLSLLTHASSAQKKVKFGEISTSDFNVPEQIRDASVGAVVLLDQGKTTFDQNFTITLTIHERILILDNTEFDRATIKIPYYRDGYVNKIKAAAYNIVDGQVVQDKLSRKEIFTEKLVDERLVERFTIPNVKEGSIIEYTYTVGSKNYYNLNTWYFQTYVPVLYSEYTVIMPSFFNYRQNLSGILSISDYQVTAENGNLGTYRFTSVKKVFIAENVPAFKKESFITNSDNYISKIVFDLIDYTWPDSRTNVVNPSTYAELSEKLVSQFYYEGIYKGNSFLKDDLEVITDVSMSDLEKAKAIYTFVQGNFYVDRTTDYDNIRKVYNEKKGYPVDVNSVLTAMLVRAGLDAHLILVSDKAHGKINMFYPARGNFNSAITMVDIEGERYMLDASKSYLAFNMLSPNTINDNGLFVSENKKGLTPIDFNNYFTEKSVAEFQVDATGTVRGSINAIQSGYAAYSLLNRHDGDLEIYKESFEQTNKDWVIDSHEVMVDDDTYDVSEKIDFTAPPLLSDLGDMIIFKPIVYNRIVDNPFREENRNLPVTLDRPLNYLVNCTIALPEGYEIVELPESKSVALPGNKGEFNFSCQVVGNNISVVSTIRLYETEYSAEEYYWLKEFQAIIIEKHKEEVVLKKKS